VSGVRDEKRRARREGEGRMAQPGTALTGTTNFIKPEGAGPRGKDLHSRDAHCKRKNAVSGWETRRRRKENVQERE